MVDVFLAQATSTPQDWLFQILELYTIPATQGLILGFHSVFLAKTRFRNCEKL